VRASNLLRWKRTLNELKFKHSELEFIEDISSSHAQEFQLYLEEFCQQKEIDLVDLNKNLLAAQTIKIEERKKGETLQLPESEIEEDGALVIHHPPPEPTSDDEVSEKDGRELYEDFSKLFKKIALYLHPDRSQGLTDKEKEERVELFKESQNALKEGRYYFLLELSDRFGVRTPKNYKQQNRWMRSKVQELDSKIQQEKITYNYKFAECDTEEERGRLMKNFIYQVFKVHVE
tara:strand:+ start:256 stop:954 length:699 start_codon:yes stop_codon:yes gene_type:complete